MFRLTRKFRTNRSTATGSDRPLQVRRSAESLGQRDVGTVVRSIHTSGWSTVR